MRTKIYPSKRASEGLEITKHEPEDVSLERLIADLEPPPAEHTTREFAIFCWIARLTSTDAGQTADELTEAMPEPASPGTPEVSDDEVQDMLEEENPIQQGEAFTRKPGEIGYFRTRKLDDEWKAIA